MADTRRSLRHRHPPATMHNSRYECNESSLRVRLVSAIESPGGITKMLNIVRSKATKDREIRELNERNWSPLVLVIFRFGCRTTKKGNTAKSEEQLDHLIRVCHQRGMSMNSGDYVGGRFHRPLIVAAYYGYYSAVRILIEFGALPDLRNGEGRNVMYAALQNPTGRSFLRECDKRTAQVLVDLGAITSDLEVWRQAPTGTLCYVNQSQQRFSSAMWCALWAKNIDAVKFLCSVGGVVNDSDYLFLRRRGHPVLRARLLVIVAEVYADSSQATTTSMYETNDDSRTKSQLVDCVKSWNPHIDWSFPPTWKVAVALCGDCGLPSAIFRTHVVPYLDRDWFYSL